MRVPLTPPPTPAWSPGELSGRMRTRGLGEGGVSLAVGTEVSTPLSAHWFQIRMQSLQLLWHRHSALCAIVHPPRNRLTFRHCEQACSQLLSFVSCLGHGVSSTVEPETHILEEQGFCFRVDCIVRYRYGQYHFQLMSHFPLPLQVWK